MLSQVSKLSTVMAAAVMISLAANAQTVTKTIALPNQNFGAIAANSVTNRIYAVSPSGSTADDTISVIDGKSDSILTNISVPAGAYYPAVNILTNKVYVASCNTLVAPSPCFVTVIDGKTNKVTASVPVTTILNGFLAGITVNPVTNKIYVSDNTDEQIVIIDGATNAVTGTINLGVAPWGLAINPINNKLYVTYGASEIDIIDAASKNIVQASTGEGTVDYNVAVDLLTGHVFVPNTNFGPSTTAILSCDGKILAQVPVGQAAYGVDVDPIKNLAFVADISDGNTSVINGKNDTLKSTIAGTSATFIAVNLVTEKVYAIGGNGVVTVSKE